MSTDNLADQLSFMKLGPEAQAHIQAAKAIIMQELPAALDAVYAQIRAFPETSKFFSSEGQIAGAKSKQLSHWDLISSARFNRDYVRGATAVGEVHAAIGLEPRWYIGGDWCLTRSSARSSKLACRSAVSIRGLCPSGRSRRN